MGIFSPDSIFMRFLNLVADILLLHILWVICSIPLITIGASTTALYYTCMKRVRNREGYIFQDFFKAFRSNFRQSTIIWLILAGTALLLFIDLRIGMQTKGMIGRVMVASSSFMLFPYLLIFLYIFPVQAKFENRIIDNFKNAILMSIQSLHYTLLIFIIIATFVFLGFFFQPFMGFLIICGAGACCYLVSGIFVIIFRKYLPEEFDEDMGEKGN